MRWSTKTNDQQYWYDQRFAGMQARPGGNGIQAMLKKADSWAAHELDLIIGPTNALSADYR